MVVSRHGAENRAYGHYFGDTVARDNYPDRIVLYQDTLERDFGYDSDLLRAQVVRILRHELAHHLGWGARRARAGPLATILTSSPPGRQSQECLRLPIVTGVTREATEDGRLG